MSSTLRVITTATPTRLSFVGGGTDLPAFYRQERGAVVSAAINQYIYVTVKQHSPLFGSKYRLNYSITEETDRLEDIRNDIARECLRLLPVDPPLYISTIADLPASSGLGSSSSFCVGLLLALHTLRDENVSRAQLAQEAVHIELEVMKRPMGKQDHYAAALGGLNYIHFHPNESVSVEPLWVPHDGITYLFANSMLFWTGVQRDSSSVLGEQEKNTEVKFDELKQMRGLADKMGDMLRHGFDTKRFGDKLAHNWELKRQLSAKISSSKIDEWYDKAVHAGAYGGKIAGAGGGGFLYLVVPNEHQNAVRKALHDMPEVPVQYEPQGARILYSTNGI